MQPGQIYTRDIVTVTEIAKERSREREREGAVKSSFSGVDALIEHYDY